MKRPARVAPTGDPDNNWHLDRKVPIALIVAIIIQTAGIVWWGATTNARISALEEKVLAAAGQPERMARFEVRLDSALDGIKDIKSVMLRLESQTQGRR